MAQTVYGLIQDNGDGSCCIRWYRSRDKVDELLEEDNGHEEFWGNEGSPAETLTFPEGLDLDQCGLHFSDKEDDEEDL